MARKQHQSVHTKENSSMKMTMEDKQRPRLLQALFPPRRESLVPAQQQQEEVVAASPPETKLEATPEILLSNNSSGSSDETCSAPPMLSSEDEKNLLLLTNAIAWGLLVIVLCVWQWKKRRAVRRRGSKRGSIQFHESSPFVDLEHETLVAALQEELHAKSVAENEQAILWRQEKRILQGRIDELVRGSISAANSTQELLEGQLLQQVKELQESVAFLTELTESQTKELEAKQQEIDKLHNILEEMQQLMGGATAGSSGKCTVVTQNTDTEDENDSDDDDADSLSIDSSADGSVAQEEVGKSRLPEGNKVVLLLSTMPGNLSTSVHQSRLESIFRQGLNLQSRFLEVIDGCDTELTCLRNDLFEISGQHAVYPQVFLVKDGDIQFLGDFETVQELHDSRQLPERIGLLLPTDDGKENSGGNSGGSKYDHLGSVLLDTNTAGIAGREASKQLMAKEKLVSAQPVDPIAA